MLKVEPSLYDVFRALRQNLPEAGAMVRTYLSVHSPDLEDAPPGDPVARLIWLGRKALARWAEGDLPGAYGLLRQAVGEDPGFAWGEALALATYWARLLERAEEARNHEEARQGYLDAWAEALAAWVEETQQEESEGERKPVYTAKPSLAAAASSAEEGWYHEQVGPWGVWYQLMNPLVLRVRVERKDGGEQPSQVTLTLGGEDWEWTGPVQPGKEVWVDWDPSRPLVIKEIAVNEEE